MSMQYYEVYLLLGSNLGERAANIANAVTQLENQEVKPVKLSALYETEPWGNKNQPSFINQAGKFRTATSAAELIQLILKIEKEMGRKRTKKWEPRIIDIDILFYGDKVITEKNLQIPHPELEKRKFALIPMSEIAPELVHPVLKKSIRDLLAASTDQMAVDFFKT